MTTKQIEQMQADIRRLERELEAAKSENEWLKAKAAWRNIRIPRETVVLPVVIPNPRPHYGPPPMYC